MKTNYLTFPVLGGAYRSLKMDSTLTHSVDVDGERVLCNKVKFTSICEDYALDTAAAPTCPTCAKRLAKVAS